MKPLPGSGTAFYEFGAPADTLALTQAFRSGLDEVIADSAQADALVAEAVLAFELHRSLFDELARRWCAGHRPLSVVQRASGASAARGVRASSASSAS